MILFDTDHLTVLANSSDAEYPHVARKMLASYDQDFGASVVSLEEQLRGWLAAISRQSANTHRQIAPYDRLAKLIEFYGDWRVVPFDAAVAAESERLRVQRIRIGPGDRKIAATALIHDALLITSNTVDFERVPGLRFEDWRHG